MMTQVDPRQAFVDTLTILATKLNREEYTRVTSTLYQLHCGVPCGFATADPMLLPTFEEVWNRAKDQRIKNKAKVKVFTVYQNENKK
jgi:hypothetical protein